MRPNRTDSHVDMRKTNHSPHGRGPPQHRGCRQRRSCTSTLVVVVAVAPVLVVWLVIKLGGG